jgi:hypothetical protein
LRSPCRASWAAALLLLLGLGHAHAAAAQGEVCGPLEASDVPGIAACREPGLAPARPPPEAPPGLTRLAPAPAGDVPLAVPGEALLAFPKRPDGSLPSDYQLGPGARIAASFFSPLLCATVARIVGPAGASPAELVPGVPEGGLVEANHVYQTAATRVRAVGDDPLRPLQYGLDALGVSDARALGDGAGARVALLDSAPETSHPDLTRVRVRPLAEGPPTVPAAHGSLMAGVIAASEGNGVGIAGVAPGADVVAVPVCTPRGASASDTCQLYHTLQGLDLAWEEQASLVNLSLVGPPNALLERALRRLDELGVVVVAAAGNEGSAEARYPAAYPSVVGVAGHDRAGRPDPRSNRGPSAEIAAPGVEIVSTHPPGSFAFADGSSLAAAHVTGALAVLVGVGGDPLAARTALFRAALREGEETPRVAPLCEALGVLGRDCGAGAGP